MYTTAGRHANCGYDNQDIRVREYSQQWVVPPTLFPFIKYKCLHPIDKHPDTNELYSGTSVKGHLPNKGQDSEHQKSHFPIIVLIHFQPPKRGHLSIMNRIACPNVSAIQSPHCVILLTVESH